MFQSDILVTIFVYVVNFSYGVRNTNFPTDVLCDDLGWSEELCGPSTPSILLSWCKISALEITKLENLDRWFKGLARAITMSRVTLQHSSNYYAIVNFS